LAGRQGFEPWLTESESVVLPLDDLPKINSDYTYFFLRVKQKPFINPIAIYDDRCRLETIDSSVAGILAGVPENSFLSAIKAAASRFLGMKGKECQHPFNKKFMPY
jgi:hypothetical protein